MAISAITPSATVASEKELSRGEFERAERRARRFWVTGIVGMLGLQVLIGVGSILLSLGDPSVAIVPNYHQAALDWDATQRARHLTEKLGWTITPAVSELVPGSHKRLVRIEVLDVNGKLVPNLNITAKAYHHARGSDLYEMHLTELESGQYEATTSLTEAGLWQLTLQIEGDHGIASQSSEIIVR